MSSVRARTGTATFVFTEPADGRSQIADFLVQNGGPGVHHLAFATNDIVETATALRARRVATLGVPAAYYQQARARLGDVDLPWDELEDLGILVDCDDDGVLLQAFTDPIGDRPTLYFEIIQRVGATGFGTENIRALYQSVVLQRVRE
jgi:4-hydroxyphenylpyruvate dioxygenase